MTKYNYRKSPRMKHYDYGTPGAYFITICTHQRQHLFGTIAYGIMRLNAHGDIAEDVLRNVPIQHDAVQLDCFVVMPNHVHLILFLQDTPQPQTTGAIIRAYKSTVTRRTKQYPLWQGRYHDHVIRDEKSLSVLREYIQKNPQRWEADTFYS
jgi:putative transposase